MRRRSVYLAAMAIGPSLLSRVSTAAEFPERPLRIIVPYAPGGSQDLIARMIGDAAAPLLRQPVLVENRPGAGAQLGAAAAARAEPDGYTLLMASPAPITIAPAVNPRLGYRPEQDFTPVVALAEERMALLIRSDLPVQNLSELLAHLRANPGAVAYSSAGVGSMGHLMGELFRVRAGVEVLHVPYRGAAPAVTAILAGEVGMGFASPGTARTLINDPKVRFIAIGADTRSALLPSVPTMAEAGQQGVAAPLWAGLMVHASTPPAVLAQLRETFGRVAADPAIRPRYSSLAVEPSGRSVGDFGRQIAEDRTRWSDLVRDADLRIE